MKIKKGSVEVPRHLDLQTQYRIPTQYISDHNNKVHIRIKPGPVAPGTSMVKKRKEKRGKNRKWEHNLPIQRCTSHDIKAESPVI